MVDKIGTYRTKKQSLLLGKVASMHKKGSSVTEIAETLHLSPTTVYVWLNAIALGNSEEVKVARSSAKSKEKASARNKEQPKPVKSKRATRRIVQKVVQQLSKDSDIDYCAAVKPNEADKPNEANKPNESNKPEENASEETKTNKEDAQSSLLRKLAAENKRLKKKLIEETIKSAALESTLEEERSQNQKGVDDLAGKTPQEIKKLNKELRKQLKHEHMRAEAYDTMIDIAEDMFDVDIRKKPGAK